MKELRASSVSENDFFALKREARRLLSRGYHEEARGALEKALILEPDASDILFLLGKCAHASDRQQEAADYYNRSLAISKQAETYHALCDLLLGAKQADEALKICERMEALKIADYDTMLRKGMAHLLKNDIPACLKIMTTAVARQPQNPDARAFISGAVRSATPNYNENFKTALLTCLQSEDMEHNFLAGAWLQQIREEPAAAKMREMVACADYESFAALYALPQNRFYILSVYVRLGIEKLVVPDPNFERFLTHLRRFYLDAVMAGDELSSEEKIFIASLAIHCFLTEYAYEETPEESAALETLKEQIESETNLVLPDEIAVFAAYRLLLDLKNAPELATSGELRRKETGPLIRYHIDEPATEREIKKTIQRLVPIENEISRAVQDQYEENPYPRWLHCHRLAPLVDRPRQNQRIKILIAGCGTGKQAVQMASILPRAEILAVDLSASSLAYGMRKAREYNIDNVTFRQGDILNLGKALEPNSFNRIECSGVLHHMQDPIAGWRVLKDLLAPGGLMNVGLYSESSRKGVVAARELIRRKGFTPDLKGIRACRDYMKTLPVSDPLGYLARWRDFYITSDCRDLIFHVQEHRFTLLQIRDALNELGLEFRGFIGLTPRQTDEFRRRFPAETTTLDLEKWHALEEEQNDLFFSMYQFYCGKPLN